MNNCHPYAADDVLFEDQRQKVVIADGSNSGGCSYKAENSDRNLLACIKVEEGVMRTSKGKKCDFLLLICPKKTAVFIELKGQDFSHAMMQLNDSIRFLHPDLKQSGFENYKAKIVLNKRKNTKYNSNPKWLILKRTIEIFNIDFTFHMEKTTDKL